MEPQNQTCSKIDHGYSNRALHLEHKTETTQWWIKNHVPKFISGEHWPSVSPDLDPLNYKLWSVLEGIICIRCHYNLESLKQVQVENVNNLPIGVICTAIDTQPNRLWHYVRADGSHL